MVNTQMFQEKKNSTGRLITVFSIVIICLLCAVTGLLINLSGRLSPNAASRSSWNAYRMREYANKLKAEGLAEQAKQAFEEYLASSDPDARTRSNIYYSIGEMMVKAGKYEDALSYLYKTETAYPDTPMKSEIGTYIVQCLENLGKPLDAEYQLESRTLLKNEAPVKKHPGVVVAKIGGREVTMGELNREIDRLPAWVKDQFSGSGNEKLEFLKEYISAELLYEKGLKLGYGRDPGITEKIGDLSRQLVIQKVLEDEVFKKIQADPADLENYYKANRDRYSEKSALRCEYILAGSAEKAEIILARIKSGAVLSEAAAAESPDISKGAAGGVLSGWVVEGGAVPGIGEDEVLSKAVFELKDDKAHIVPSGKGECVVRVVERKEERVKDYDEVRKLVEAQYRQEKSQVLMHALLMGLLNTEDVEIYEDKFSDKKGAPGAAAGAQGEE
ncbi:MAG: peptidyl-prolyl cis-trans isomerase [Candidatus Omnitrophota bacterium]